MSGADAQVAIAEETTYGTYVAPTRFARFISEGLEEDRTPIESESMQRSQVRRADSFQTNFLGVSGDVTVECGVSSIGAWIPALLGAVSVDTYHDEDGDEVTGVFVHTANLPLTAHAPKSYTIQAGRPLSDSDTIAAFTYTGCVVTAWELSVSVDGFLQLKLTIDGQNVVINQPLASQSSGTTFDELFSWAGGLVEIGGVQVDVTSFTLGVTYAHKTDRRYIRRNTLKKRPFQDGFTEITWSADLDFTDLSHYERYRNANPQAQLFNLTASFRAGGQIGSTGVAPELKFYVPAARNDNGAPTVGGPEALTQTIGGVALTPVDGVTPAIGLEFITGSATL